MVRALLVWLLTQFAVAAFAATRVTVDQLNRIVVSSRAKPDARIAGRLQGLELTERLSAARLAAFQALEDVQVKLPAGIRIRVNLDRATADLLASLKRTAEAAPGPGKIMLHLEKKNEYAVILEPEGMGVAADRAWMERIEELLGKGAVQTIA